MLSYIHMSLEKTSCIFLNNCISSDTYTGSVLLYVSWMENRYLSLPRYQLVITDVYSSLLILTHYRCILVIADINSSFVITDINSSLSQYELVISDIYSSFTDIYSSFTDIYSSLPISTRHYRYLLIITPRSLAREVYFTFRASAFSLASFWSSKYRAGPTVVQSEVNYSQLKIHTCMYTP